MTTGNADMVFVALSPVPELGILEWALNHFDNSKTKIIITCFYDPVLDVAAVLLGSPSSSINEFSDATKREYLRRCSTKKFAAETLTAPASRNVKLSIWELIIKNGMKKIVMPAFWRSEISELLDEFPHLLCKIWYVEKGRLISERTYGPDPDLQKASREVEKFKKAADEVKRFLSEETTKRKNIEVELLLMTDRAKKHEQNKNDIKGLLKEEASEKNFLLSNIEQLKERISLLNVENEQNLHEANEKHKKNMEKLISDHEECLASLQSDYYNLQVERDTAVKEAEMLREQRLHTHSRFNVGLTSNFTLQELECATQNFSDSLKIGEGGFGSVYKGSLRGTTIAIKKLDPQSMQGLPEFQREVEVLTRVRHPNLVILIGACSEACALVYEYLPNGSLESHLVHANNTPPLTWQLRTRIISEICIALIFLHSSKPNLVVHGDLKPDNILLDANFVSKLSDFGISRLIKQPDTNTTASYMTYRPVGTFAYMDPEFLQTGQLTAKSDIYSFGVIILRLLTGKLPLNIVRHVKEVMQNDTFHTIIDAFAGNWPVDKAKELAKIGLRCADICSQNRPDLVNEVWPTVEALMKSALVSMPLLSGQSAGDEGRIPSHFICPISQEIMKDPHIAADGFTYEAEAIRCRLNGAHNTSPMTNLPLPHNDLIPNHALRSAIQEWMQQNR